MTAEGINTGLKTAKPGVLEPNRTPSQQAKPGSANSELKMAYCINEEDPSTGGPEDAKALIPSRRKKRAYHGYYYYAEDWGWRIMTLIPAT